MRTITGTHVEGDDFCGREHELALCKKKIEVYEDILLLSPRRVGKTSLSAELGRILHGEGWVYIRCDVQSAKNEKQFLALLSKSIEAAKIPETKTAKKEVKDALNSVKSIQLTASAFKIERETTEADFDWWKGSSEMSDILGTLASLDVNVYLVLDELPIFLAHLYKQTDGKERVSQILDWLNSVRENDTRKGMAWFLCGSIGLDSLLEQFGMSGKIQKFSILPLGPMTRNEASELVERLCINPDSDTKREKVWIEHFLDKVGWLIPSYIQILFDVLSNIPLSERSDDFPSVRDVDKAYQTMISIRYASKFAHWDERLSDAFTNTEQVEIAKSALKQVCKNPAGMERERVKEWTKAEILAVPPDEFEEVFNHTVHLLQNDGYFHIADDLVAFRSPILRDYWKNKHSI